MQQNFIEDNIIILSKQTMDLLLAQETPSNLIGLYTFYYYTAKWQKTNQPKCNTNYTAKGLGWGVNKVREVKGKLIKLGLIQDVENRGENGEIIGHYIKINYLWKANNSEKVSSVSSTLTETPPVVKSVARNTKKKEKSVENTTGGKTPRVVKSTTNALSVNNQNALSVNNLNASPNGELASLPKTTESDGEILSPDEMLKKVMDQNIKQLFEVFYKNNPCSSGNGFFGRPTFRNDARFLIEQYGLDGAVQRAKVAVSLLGSTYAPQITNPSELRQKMPKLESFFARAKNKPRHIMTDSDFPEIQNSDETVNDYIARRNQEGEKIIVN